MLKLWFGNEDTGRQNLQLSVLTQAVCRAIVEHCLVTSPVTAPGSAQTASRKRKAKTNLRPPRPNGSQSGPTQAKPETNGHYNETVSGTGLFAGQYLGGTDPAASEACSAVSDVHPSCLSDDLQNGK